MVQGSALGQGKSTSSKVLLLVLLLSVPPYADALSTYYHLLLGPAAPISSLSPQQSTNSQKAQNTAIVGYKVVVGLLYLPANRSVPCCGQNRTSKVRSAGKIWESMNLRSFCSSMLALGVGPKPPCITAMSSPAIYMLPSLTVCNYTSRHMSRCMAQLDQLDLESKFGSKGTACWLGKGQICTRTNVPSLSKRRHTAFLCCRCCGGAA